MAACSLTGFISSASAQLSFSSGLDPSAGPNAIYAAGLFYNFSNAGGQGGFSVGTGGNLNGGNVLTWFAQTWDFSFTYNPINGVAAATVTTPGRGGEGGGATITVGSIPPTELQILENNSGIGDLILNLTSINSVGNGGMMTGMAGASEVVGGAENFAAGTTFSAANGTTLQAYLDSPTLFSAGFTLNGTITLDAPANSTDYGGNLNSLIEFNLTNTPEPSTWALMAGGAGLLAVVRSRRKG